MYVLKPESEFHNYRIVRLLGQGGMGKVYEAVEKVVERRVALKIIINDPEASGRDELVKRFVNEAKALAQISNENVVSRHGVGEAEGAHFIAMELVEGLSLREMLNRYVLSAEEASLIGIQLLRGLSALHNINIIHRDLSPPNIIVKYNGVV